MVPDGVCVAEPSTTAAPADLPHSITIAVADYRSEQAAIRAVRFAVFVDEQKVPAALEMDERDIACLHVLARDREGNAVGTGRVDIDAGGRIGRMAVLAPWRGHGVGAGILAALHRLARERGCTQLWCHAQTAAQAFYEAAGYVSEGAVFEEAGIAHITMRCSLRR